MTETKKPSLETGQLEPIGAALAPLGELISEVTIGHNELGVPGSSSRVVRIDENSRVSLIFREDDKDSLGPVVMIQKDTIESTKDDEVLKRYSLRWPKDYPSFEIDQLLTIINPSAEKDTRREIRGNSLRNYYKDEEAARQLIKDAWEALNRLDG